MRPQCVDRILNLASARRHYQIPKVRGGQLATSGGQNRSEVPKKRARRSADNLYLVGVILAPVKAIRQRWLIRNAELAGSIALEPLEAIARWHPKVADVDPHKILFNEQISAWCRRGIRTPTA